MTLLTDVSYNQTCVNGWNCHKNLPVQYQPVVTGIAGSVVAVKANGSSYYVTIKPSAPIFWPAAFTGLRGEDTFQFFTSTQLVVGQPVVFDLQGADGMIIPANIQA